MYLANRKVRKSYYDSTFKITSTLTKEDKLAMVAKLRNGDMSVVDPLIEAHIQLVVSVVCRYVSYFPRKADDMSGIAMVTLVESVRNFRHVATNNEITPYIVCKVHGAISNFLDQDKTVKTTVYTVNKAIKEARKTGEKVHVNTSVSIESRKGDEDHVTEIEDPRSQNDVTVMEVQEILDTISLTSFEAKILAFMMEGFSGTEIAQKMLYSKQHISRVTKTMLAKVVPVLKESYKDKFNDEPKPNTKPETKTQEVLPRHGRDFNRFPRRCMSLPSRTDGDYIRVGQLGHSPGNV